MKIKLSLLFILLVLNVGTVAQTILKRNKLNNQLIKIDSLYSAKQYEKAMLLFYSKDEAILDENVSKKLFDMYNRIKSSIETKKKDFQITKINVENLNNEFVLKHYCKSVDLINIELNNENSYLETQTIKQNLLPALLLAKNKCDSNSLKINQWNMQYQNQEYEDLYRLLLLPDNEVNYFNEADFSSFCFLRSSLLTAKVQSNNYSNKIMNWKINFENEEFESLYDLLHFDESEKKYFYKQDLLDFNTMVNSLQEKFKTYKKVSELLAEKTYILISETNYTLNDTNQAKNIIDTLNSNIAKCSILINGVPGKNPNLIQKFKKINELVDSTVQLLSNNINRNRTITTANKEYPITPILNLEYLALVFNYLIESRDCSIQGKIIGSEKSEKEAKKVLEKLIIPNRKFIIQIDSSQYFYLVMETGGGEISFSDVTNYDKRLTCKFYRYDPKSDERNLETSDLILEKLENIPHDPWGSQTLGKFNLLVQIIPRHKSIPLFDKILKDESKYFFASYISGVKIFIKILNVY